MTARYTDVDRNVLMIVELMGPMTVDEVVAAYAGSERQPGAAAQPEAPIVRESMHRLAIFSDIVFHEDLWWRAWSTP